MKLIELADVLVDINFGTKHTAVTELVEVILLQRAHGVFSLRELSAKNLSVAKLIELADVLADINFGIENTAVTELVEVILFQRAHGVFSLRELSAKTSVNSVLKT